MADMDTASKRFSAMRWQQPYGNAMPPVDGAFDQGDRFHLMFQYSGIAAAAVLADPIVCLLAPEVLWIKSHRRDVLSWRVEPDVLGVPVVKPDVLRC